MVTPTDFAAARPLCDLPPTVSTNAAARIRAARGLLRAGGGVGGQRPAVHLGGGALVEQSEVIEDGRRDVDVAHRRFDRGALGEATAPRQQERPLLVGPEPAVL